MLTALGRDWPPEDHAVNRQEISTRARNAGIDVDGLDMLAAVRAIQRAEGFEPCFGSGCFDTCGQAGCVFRADCERIQVIDDPCQVVVCDLPQ
jgi:hypothetical protein